MAKTTGDKNQYRGRFAPSPTGPLHFGSLVSAVASYLQAKSNKGTWLVRIEDIDPPRQVPGSIDDILRTLEIHGLHWDENVIYQSQQREHHQAALDTLQAKSLLYYCQCSRKAIREIQQRTGVPVYPGTCRDSAIPADDNLSMRINTHTELKDPAIEFTDLIQGPFKQSIAQEVGDFILRRTEGFIAYQLAVVVDDAYEGITEVVRGCDLLDNTPRQIFLQRQLSLPEPTYAHHPVATKPTGEKLSKQTGAAPVDQSSPIENLIKVLDFLGQNPPNKNEISTLDELWDWAISHWKIGAIPKVKQNTVTGQA